jgi:short-subunit dehydrogenase
MTASEVARIGYQALKDGRGVVITGLLNKLMVTSSRLSPAPMSLRIANWMMLAGK